LIAGLAPRIHAQAPAPLTLDGAITRALASNRTLTAARLLKPVAAAGLGIAQERLNPELTYEAEKELPHQAIGFALPIELGGKRARRMDVANAGILATDAEIARTIADVQNDVRRTYFTLVAAERRLALANESRALAARVRDTANARVQAGDVPRLELVQTQIGLSDADQDVTAANGEVTAARAELNVLIGQSTDAPIVLADALDAVPLRPLPDLIGQVREANSTIVALDRRIAEQVAKRALAVAMKKSDLTAGASLTYNAEPEFRVGWRASAGITLPLFTTHQAGVVLEDAELMRLRAERDATLVTTEAAVTAAFARAAAAREQVTRFETEIVPNLQEADQMVQAGYSAGQTPLITLLTALQQTRESRRKGLQAALDYQLALADLERAVGTRLR